MDNPIKLTALCSQPLTPQAQLFAGYWSLLRACLCLDERLAGSCRKQSLWLIRAIFSELQGSWYSSPSAVAVLNQSWNELWVWEGSFGPLGTAQALLYSGTRGLEIGCVSFLLSLWECSSLLKEFMDVLPEHYGKGWSGENTQAWCENRSCT